MNFTDEQIQAAWEKAQQVEGYDPKRFRKDPCGAWIIRDKYGIEDSPYGWEIDHIVPRSFLELIGKSNSLINLPINLRAMQWQNNRYKGDFFPSYLSKVIANGNKNEEREERMTINSKIFEKLKEIYNI